MESTNAEITQFQKWISKHFVSLVLIYWHLNEQGNSTGKPHITACSGFVMSFGNTWFLASAGHVLQDLDKLVAHEYVKVVAYDRSLGRQTTALSFIVGRPPIEPGFRLERQEKADRQIRYTLHAYATDLPSGSRYGANGNGGEPRDAAGPGS